ncbi:hypothetical protein Mgra_00008617 [Meloidogyne graminicola]|uniref:Uncharacterized protein n=1 Tax=Meloidogyne graminicola TaxID=189291 RepID=A0A8S9ZFA1_9BILA|nr:hypothetical protein Mgra_00008617 [Meloidogyne graminicola]
MRNFLILKWGIFAKLLITFITFTVITEKNLEALFDINSTEQITFYSNISDNIENAQNQLPPPRQRRQNFFGGEAETDNGILSSALSAMSAIICCSSLTNLQRPFSDGRIYTENHNNTQQIGVTVAVDKLQIERSKGN